MFLRNAWYVAAWDHEVCADALLGRILLDEPVVLYRTRDGQVVALEDRCCHRHYPLHKGTLTQDCIQCRYHGFTYDGAGRCVRVPGQSNIPEAARVKSYPVVGITGSGSGWAIRGGPTNPRSSISTGWTIPTGAPKAPPSM
jgi:phenylpropionate dioxygenase-like ring-hydroxylating dioxygenase large terminal subunit